MYWNCWGILYVNCFIIDKLQHEMYWNLHLHLWTVQMHLINYNMRCIETCDLEPDEFKGIKINYNMRCIETNMGYT